MVDPGCIVGESERMWRLIKKKKERKKKKLNHGIVIW